MAKWFKTTEQTKPEDATAMIAVWWDMNDCPIPDGYDAFRVRSSIQGAFKKLGYTGPVSITAYGDQKRTPYDLLRGLSSTGVALVHTIPANTCANMYSDMLEWRGRNPPPATMMLISDLVEDVFSWDLSRLQQETRYNFFMAYKYAFNYPSSLRISAEWLWETLLAASGTETQFDGESTGMFYCNPCSFDGHRLQNFRKHLWSTKHELEEGQIISHRGIIDFVSVTREWARNYPAKPEYATSQISVWWDMTDCPVPESYDATQVRLSIQTAFKQLGYTGPVSITAYGDLTQTPDHILQGLSSTGVHVSHRLSIVNSKCILLDLDIWERLNPTPATIMLITNQLEDCLAESLARRQQWHKYNLCVAYLFRPYQMLPLLTSAEWLWESLLLAGKDSATRPFLCKCSNEGGGDSISTGMFYCKACSCCISRLDDLRDHLSDSDHELEEGRIHSRYQHSQYLRDERKEEDVLKRIRSSKYKQELGLEAKNFPKSKRFPTGFSSS